MLINKTKGIACFLAGEWHCTTVVAAGHQGQTPSKPGKNNMKQILARKYWSRI